MYRDIEPKLSLVGAGPGDPDLLTIKAVKTLASARVVLYDALANKEILQYAPKKSKKIYVGKRRGTHRFTQEKINELIIFYAFKYGHVVRLKGGDPFVFGRASEEIDAASNVGINTEVIPGITSAISVPAYQGIALTQRGVSHSFWVMTGTTAKGELSKDISLAAKSSATLVILMGMGKLRKIVQLLQEQGKGDTPIAIIQNGTLPNEKTGIGTVNSIEHIVLQKRLGPPAIIVVGEVVRERRMINKLFKELQENEYAALQNQRT